VAYPPQTNEDGTGPFQVAAEVAGGWPIFLVIDVDNFELVDPYLEENGENAAGKGHWHLVIDGKETPIPGLSFANIEIDAEDGEIGELVTLTASLKNNDHSQISNPDGDPLEASVEVELVGPP
jgi:hypothetical protein